MTCRHSHLKIITLTGVATLVLAPFGAFALNLSAITAAICMGPEAHEDPRALHRRRVLRGMYVLIGLFGATVTGLLTAFPKELVAAIAGLALLGTIGNGLAGAAGRSRTARPRSSPFWSRSAAWSLGVGSAFWGVVAGALALFVQQYGLATADHLKSRTMNILFVADPLESFKIYKDTTFAMMREAQRAATAWPPASRAIWSGSAGRGQAPVRTSRSPAPPTTGFASTAQ
jgi:hypothetical protein